MPLTLDTPLQPSPDVIATELTDRNGAPEAVLGGVPKVDMDSNKMLTRH